MMEKFYTKAEGSFYGRIIDDTICCGIGKEIPVFMIFYQG